MTESKFTPFGIVSRQLRDAYSIQLTEMANEIEMSPSQLYSIEKGTRTLHQRHIDSIYNFFKRFCNNEQLEQLVKAGKQSLTRIDISHLSSEQREQIILLILEMSGKKKPKF